MSICIHNEFVLNFSFLKQPTGDGALKCRVLGSFNQKDCAGSLEPFDFIVAAHINILVRIYQMCHYYSLESKSQSALDI